MSGAAAVLPFVPPLAQALVLVPAAPDLDAIIAGFMARAAALLGSGAVIAGADALVSDVVASPLPDAVFKVVADAIGKATGYDTAAYSKQMQGARAALAKPGATAGARPVSGIQNPDPDPNPDSLEKVVDQAVRTIMRQVVCSPHAAVAVVLWVVGTFGFQDAPIFPRLMFTSPTKRCGKSTLLGTVAALVSKPIKADNVTASVMFRVIEQWRPTLLIDEVDAFFSKGDELRGVVNSGYERSGTVMRSSQTPDGKDWVATQFNTFGPVALAGIGGLPDTVLDRSIVIKLERAPKRGVGGLRQAPMRHRDLEKLRALIVPHLVAHQPAIEAAMTAGCTVLPRELSDRAQDNWEPLLAIADLIGGTWPARAREAALVLSGGEDAQSHREMLLADLRVIVDGERAAAVQAWQGWRSAGRKGARPAAVRRIRSSAALMELLKLEHRPWPEYGKDGKGITLARLAAMLRPFGIEPSVQRVPVLTPHKLTTTATKTARTYPVPALQAAFRQYL